MLVCLDCFTFIYVVRVLFEDDTRKNDDDSDASFYTRVVGRSASARYEE